MFDFTQLSSSHHQFLAAGLRLYPELGYHKLSVRVLAAEAGLSSGMFHHLFENKDDFIHTMLALHHAQIAPNMQIDHTLPPQMQLRMLLRGVAINIREHLPWLQRMLTDCADGADVVAAFLRSRSHEHFALVGALLRECAPEWSEREYLVRLNFLTSATTAPILFTAQFAQLGMLPPQVQDALPEYLSDDVIELRLDWVFRALFL